MKTTGETSESADWLVSSWSNPASFFAAVWNDRAYRKRSFAGTLRRFEIGLCGLDSGIESCKPLDGFFFIGIRISKFRPKVPHTDSGHRVFVVMQTLHLRLTIRPARIQRRPGDGAYVASAGGVRGVADVT